MESQLVDLLTSRLFDINMLKRYIKTLRLKNVITRNTSKLIKDKEICGVLATGSIVEKDGHSTL